MHSSKPPIPVDRPESASHGRWCDDLDVRTYEPKIAALPGPGRRD